MRGVKVNCWEHTGCGRERGGHREHELGVCPAAVCAEADGLHGGVNGGRVCWMVADTLCDDTRQHELAAKIERCSTCEFMRLVHAEEERVELSLV